MFVLRRKYQPPGFADKISTEVADAHSGDDQNNCERDIESRRLECREECYRRNRKGEIEPAYDSKKKNSDVSVGGNKPLREVVFGDLDPEPKAECRNRNDRYCRAEIMENNFAASHSLMITLVF